MSGRGEVNRRKSCSSATSVRAVTVSIPRKQRSQLPRIPPIRFDPLPRLHRNQRGRHHDAAHPFSPQLPLHRVPPRTSLLTTLHVAPTLAHQLSSQPTLRPRFVSHLPFHCHPLPRPHHRHADPFSVNIQPNQRVTFTHDGLLSYAALTSPRQPATLRSRARRSIGSIRHWPHTVALLSEADTFQGSFSPPPSFWGHNQLQVAPLSFVKLARCGSLTPPLVRPGPEQARCHARFGLRCPAFRSERQALTGSAVPRWTGVQSWTPLQSRSNGETDPLPGTNEPGAQLVICCHC